MSKARDNVYKLENIIFANEPRFGIPFGGVDDAAPALQALIDANAGKNIIFVAGSTLRLNSTIVVNTSNTKLISPFGKVRVVNATANGDAFHFTTTSNIAFQYLNNVALENFYIYRNTHTSTAGAGLRLTGVNSGRFTGLYVLDCPEGIRIFGGQLNVISDVQVFAANMQDISGTAGSTLLGVYERPCASSTFEPCYTLQLIGGNIGAGYKVQSCIHIGQVDGFQAAAFYASAGKDCIVRYQALRNGSYIAGVTWASCYFDAIDVATGSTNIVQIPEDGFASSSLSSISHSACNLNNSRAAGVLVRKGVSHLNFAGGEIANTGTWSLDYEPATTSGSVAVAGTRFNNASAGAATGVVRVSNINNADISATLSRGAGSTGPNYQLSGTNGRVSVRGPISSGTILDRSGATFQTFDFSPTPPTDAFTPTLTFGGASTGVIGTFAGNYTLGGGRCHGDITISLSSKGTATGAVAIGGLPFPVARSAVANVRLSLVTAGVGDTALLALCDSATSTITIAKMAAGTTENLTDADFTNTSFIRIAFSYQV